MPCGEGKKTRLHFCARIEKSQGIQKYKNKKKVAVDSKYCEKLPIPKPAKTAKKCNMKHCRWKYSDWSHCGLGCNEGNKQTRSATCITAYGYNVTFDLCKSPLLERSRSCLECTTETAHCNCGGYRKQTKTCKLIDSITNCLEDIKWERCHPPPSCSPHPKVHKSEPKKRNYPRQCSHFRKSKKDGEYTVYLKGKPVRIYCHNMNSTYPKEYITVNEHNYSVFSDRCKSLQHWEAIKHNSGHTNFKKIRINLQQLQLIANDFSFASTYGNPQLLASAGDCYHNNPECSRGEFSLDLTGTGFKIQPNNKWTTYGNNSTMAFSQIVSILSFVCFFRNYYSGSRNVKGKRTYFYL